MAASAPTLYLSTSSTRTSPKVLNGLRVAVPAYVFVSAESGITKVVFRIDGSTARTETAAPWDFAGTVAATGRAYAYDFTKLSGGSHTITADVTRSGVTTRISATFTVVKPAVSAAVPGVSAPTRSAVPVPVVTATSAPPEPTPTSFTVTSPVGVTHAPYVQDMNYTACQGSPVLHA